MRDDYRAPNSDTHRVVPMWPHWCNETIHLALDLQRQGFTLEQIAKRFNRLYTRKGEKPLTRGAVAGKLFRVKDRIRKRREWAAVVNL